MLRANLLKKMAIPIIIAISFLFYKFFPKVKQDNFIEEAIEVVVQSQMGVDVDLSPETPED